ncbi:hypothetical protein KSP39_PZI007874 [Platanthera zijinensis]|uniref:Uncharacterized protein n=1 Tax=Platanthera zijinensis TaxID=2320716 RepID=A0AAP0G939_9ASPA
MDLGVRGGVQGLEEAVDSGPLAPGAKGGGGLILVLGGRGGGREFYLSSGRGEETAPDLLCEQGAEEGRAPLSYPGEAGFRPHHLGPKAPTLLPGTLDPSGD